MSESQEFYNLDKKIVGKLEREEDIPKDEAIEYASLAIIELRRRQLIT